MNLPNKLTISRMVMIPIFVVCYYVTVLPFNYFIAAGIFLIATLTDFLDGYIARKHNLVTNFGKFLDPIADKVLVATALIVLLVPPSGVTVMPWYAVICVIVIIARELIVSGFRLVAANGGKVIAADKSGKLKTFFTDIAILVLIISAGIKPVESLNTVNWVGFGLIVASAFLTVVSGIEMIIKNISVLREEK